MALRLDASSLDAVKQSVQQWARRLPFGACGFQFWSSVNNAPIAATGVATPIVFDTALHNNEGFGLTTGGTVITVPKGKAGLYVVDAQIYWGANVLSTVQAAIARTNTGQAIQGTETRNNSTDRTIVPATVAFLNENDQLSLTVRNNSASGAITPTTFTANANNPYMTVIQAWRFALLPDSATH